MHEQIADAHLNLSSDMAMALARDFFKKMAQPFPLEAQLGKSLWSLEHLLKFQSENQ